MVEVNNSAELFTNTTVKEVTDEGVVCQRDGEEFVVKADTVVCALGFKSAYDKVDELCELVDENYVIGDCKSVGLIYNAVNQGYYTAMRL